MKLAEQLASLALSCLKVKLYKWWFGTGKGDAQVKNVLLARGYETGKWWQWSSEVSRIFTTGVYWKHWLPPGQEAGALTQWRCRHTQLPIIKTNILLGPKAMYGPRRENPWENAEEEVHFLSMYFPCVEWGWQNLSHGSAGYPNLEIELSLLVTHRSRQLPLEAEWVTQHLRLKYGLHKKVVWFEDQVI